MSIAKTLEMSKEWLTNIPKDILFLFVSILACSASFGLGMITEREMGRSQGVQFGTFPETSNLSANALSATETTTPARKTVAPETIEATANATPPGAKYVASKTGTRYYLPNCSGVKRIKSENKVWFETKEEAEAAGLAAASNCPGL